MTLNDSAPSKEKAWQRLPECQNPPVLAGYTYEPAAAYAARDAGRLLAIRLETNRTCNLRCLYCYAESGQELANEMRFNVLTDLVRQASEMGAQSVVIIGGGEPTIHPQFRQLVGLVHSLGMIPVIFTNGLRTSRQMADFLYERNASVMVKLDSLSPTMQDFFVGRPGSFARMQRGLNQLLTVGFGRPNDLGRLRLGASFVSCRLNVGEIEEIWHFCRQQNIFPNMEVLTPTGRAKANLADQGLTPEEIQEYKFRLLDIDRNCYGYDWLPYTPLTASGCLQHLYSLYITIEGNVRPCAPVKFDEHPELKRNNVYPHNVQRRRLKDIYNDPLFQYVRNIDSRLQGKCKDCEHHNECIGCRGYAYSMGVDEGKSPCEALRGECRQCFR